MSTTLQALKKTGLTAIGLIHPLNCLICKTWIAWGKGSAVCNRCLPSIPLNQPPFCPGCGAHTPADIKCICEGKPSSLSRIFYPMLYEGNAKYILQRFKIAGDASAVSFAEELVVALAARADLRQFDALCPVPGYRLRLTKEHPSVILASILAKKTGIGVKKLIRRRLGRKQSGLNRQNRLKNAQRLFKASSQADKLRILLIDDMMTTGATASACAKELKAKGAKAVSLFSLAKRP